MSTFLTLAAASETGEVALPMPPWGFWLLGIAVFLALLVFVWLFRHTAKSLIEGGHGPNHEDYAQGNAPGVPGQDGWHGTQRAAGPEQGRRH